MCGATKLPRFVPAGSSSCSSSWMWRYASSARMPRSGSVSSRVSISARPRGFLDSYPAGLNMGDPSTFESTHATFGSDLLSEGGDPTRTDRASHGLSEARLEGHGGYEEILSTDRDQPWRAASGACVARCVSRVKSG